MNLNSKHIKAILNFKELRKALLMGEQISEEEFKNYDELVGENKELATSEVMYVMNSGYADTVMTYSNPIEQYTDPIRIYGGKGVYLVVEVDTEKFNFFTDKKSIQVC